MSIATTHQTTNPTIIPLPQQERPLIIGIVAGEVSGDILGAGLINSLKQQHPNAKFMGVAGPLMKAQGCEALFEMEELAVMGVVEVLARLPRILAIRKALLKTFTEIKPDVFVGIDAPDFNLTLEEKLKSCGIKTIHYVSPSVWAWRQKRIFKIARATDLVLALLPFEKAFYDKHNVPCLFVGHTLADQLPLEADKQSARLSLNLDVQRQYMAILPGSRSAEVELLGPIFLASAKALANRLPDLHFIVPMVNQARRLQFEQLLTALAPELIDKIHVVDSKSREALTASDATLLASGTATLECMLAKSPMVVGYRMKPMNYWIGKKLVKTKFISLPNLLADAPVVTELLQDECTVENITEALLALLADTGQSTALKAKFTELHHLIRCNADEQAAQAVLSIALLPK